MAAGPSPLPPLAPLGYFEDDKSRKRPVRDSEIDICSEPPPETKDFIFQQVMLRIKDPKKALPFYTNVLGMTLLKRLDLPDKRFTVFYLGYEPKEDVPKDEKERAVWAMTRKATLELTHNWGTENMDDFAYNTGNREKVGYGHIGILVPDVDKASERFEKLGVNFIKKPHEGNLQGFALIMDPDGYWIEVFSKQAVVVNQIH